MLARSHKLQVGQTGIVGIVAGNGLPRIALDTGADAVFFDNPDLPDTRSEMAIPLFREGRQIIGVLDIQSTEPNAFGQEDIQALNSLTDQVAVAVNNALLFEETQKALRESEAAYRRNLRSGWARYARSQNLAGVRRRSYKTQFLSEPVELPGADEALRSGNVHVKKDDGENATRLAVPIRLRGEIVGVLNVQTDREREFSRDELDIVNAIIERAALSIENARLLEESRRTADRERAISDIAAKISTGTELETILKTAVRELGSQISGAQVTIELGEDGHPAHRDL